MLKLVLKCHDVTGNVNEVSVCSEAMFGLVNINQQPEQSKVYDFTSYIISKTFDVGSYITSAFEFTRSK